MNDAIAIDGELFGYRTMADGALRLTIDLNESQAKTFHQLFPAVHCRVAVTPLISEFDQPATGEKKHVDLNSAPW